MRQVTFNGSVYVRGAFGFGRKLGSQGTYRSFHTSIRDPSPTKKQAPLLTNCFILSTAFQVCDAYFLGASRNQFSDTLYLLLRASMQGLFLLEAIIQESFAIRASLYFFAFLNPTCHSSLVYIDGPTISKLEIYLSLSLGSTRTFWL